MDYKSLPQESLDGDLLEAPIHDGGFPPITPSKWNRTKVFLQRNMNRIVFLIHLSLICAYIVLIFISRTHMDIKSEMQFGRDFDYMSLDHKYDNLWGGRAVEEAGVLILKEHGGPYTDIEHGAISM
jgi:hypothetical protein